MAQRPLLRKTLSRLRCKERRGCPKAQRGQEPGSRPGLGLGRPLLPPRRGEGGGGLGSRAFPLRRREDGERAAKSLPRGDGASRGGAGSARPLWGSACQLWLGNYLEVRGGVGLSGQVWVGRSLETLGMDPVEAGVWG